MKPVLAVLAECRRTGVKPADLRLLFGLWMSSSVCAQIMSPAQLITGTSFTMRSSMHHAHESLLETYRSKCMYICAVAWNAASVDFNKTAPDMPATMTGFLARRPVRYAAKATSLLRKHHG